MADMVVLALAAFILGTAAGVLGFSAYMEIAYRKDREGFRTMIADHFGISRG